MNPIAADDLARFALIASQDRDDFFARYARPQHFLCSALCQGAAKHYMDRVNGVKDIDVWSFFVKTAGVPHFNAPRRVERDLGPSKFGVHPDDARRGFTGRRVDILGRSIDVAPPRVRNGKRMAPAEEGRRAVGTQGPGRHHSVAGLIGKAMRNISFMLTQQQVLARTKTVTRCVGWAKLKAGDMLRGVE